VKILTIVGARPQFIKAAAVSRVLRRSHTEILLHTGQHYDDNMSQVFFRELEIPVPDYALGVGSGSHAAQIAGMLLGIDAAIDAERPDAVLVYGDTNSTVAGALAAAKRHVPIAHVEAGLRSFNNRMPEEINRIVADRISTWLFCPSDTAVRNLEAEGLSAGVHMVGDVMRDAIDAIASALPADGVARFGVSPGEYVLATIHRAENTDDPERLARIIAGLAASALPVVLPLHPRTRAALAAAGCTVPAPIRTIDPVGYADMIALERSARTIVTDSGGVQKEAYWLGVPAVTVRDETEWVETVSRGWNVLVGADTLRLADALRSFSPPAARPELYGDGHAADRIDAVLTRAN
jgi:UDP-N-acetylglucosamine 2-epimerase